MSMLEAILVGLLAVSLVAILRMWRARNEARAAAAVLEANLQARDAMLATTAHEIRNPLNGILGMTQILLANWRIDGDVRDQVKVMHRAGEAMLTLVDDILDAAKLAQGEIVTVREDVQFRALLEDAARLWSARAQAKRIGLHLDIAGAPDQLRSDGARLRQIVGNLLSNAIKFTTEGAVTLRAFADGDSVVVEVRDSGIGIPAAQLPRIFEAYQQVAGQDARRFGGTGLGLSISRSLAQALGGYLDADSVEGEGSAFTLRIPFDRVATPVVRPQPAALGQVRMLLLEANPMTQGVFRGLIEPAVERFDCLADVSAAMAALAAGQVDHLLADARSAGMAGLRDLIDVARDRCVPVTVLAAPADGLSFADIEALEPLHLIVKPVAGATLIALLQDAWTVDTVDNQAFTGVANNPVSVGA